MKYNNEIKQSIILNVVIYVNRYKMFKENQVYPLFFN